MKIRMRDGSGFRDYKYLKSDFDRHGNPRLYFRRGNEAKVRLLNEPGTVEFETEYQNVYAGTQPIKIAASTETVQSGTMRWLCVQYMQSSAFQSLDESTKYVRRGTLDRICKTEVVIGNKKVQVGTFRYSTMQSNSVAKLRDKKTKTPHAANDLVKTLRQVFDWACLPEYRYATINPAREVKYLATNNPEGFKSWNEIDLEKYEDRHPTGTQARLALDLLLYLGVRRSDVVRLGPQMEQWSTDILDDGTAIRVQKICFSEIKGRKKIKKEHALPILPPLRASIDATPTGHLVYLATIFGKPRSVKAFGNWFKARCREAGLDPELSAHGVRKLSATRAADAGATIHELMAMFGWRKISQAEPYTQNANRKRLEAIAARRVIGQTGNKVAHFSDRFEKVGQNGAKK